MAKLTLLGGAPETTRLIQPAMVGRYTERSFAAITPDVMQAILREAERGELERWADLCEWIAEDDRVESVLTSRIESVSSLRFDVIAAVEGDALAEAGAEACRKMLQATPNLETIFDEIMNAIAVGYSVLEHQWRRERGAWVSSPVAVRPRDIRFASDWGTLVRTYGDISPEDRATTSNEPSTAAYNWLRTDAHPGKFISFVYRKRGSTPLRSGVIRSVAWYWLFKRWAIKWWSKGAEKLANRPMIGRVEREAPPSVRNALRDGLRNFSADHIAILEGKTSIEFPDTGFVDSAEVWKQLVEKCDAGITIAVLGSLDNVDGGGVGSMARAASQAETTIEPRIQKLARALYGVVERDWLRPYLEYNTHLFGGRVPPTPRIDVAKSDAKPTKEIFQYHLQGGLVTRNEVRAQLGLEALAPDQGGDELLDLRDTPSGAPVPSDPLASGGTPAELPLPSSEANLSEASPERRSFSATMTTETCTDSASLIARALFNR